MYDVHVYMHVDVDTCTAWRHRWFVRLKAPNKFLINLNLEN